MWAGQPGRRRGAVRRRAVPPRPLELYRKTGKVFTPRQFDLPVPEVEVAIMALGARLGEKDAVLEGYRNQEARGNRR